jgi:hypothetical protein
MAGFRTQKRIAVLYSPLMAAGRAEHGDQDGIQVAGHRLNAARQPSAPLTSWAGIVHRHVSKPGR